MVLFLQGMVMGLAPQNKAGPAARLSTPQPRAPRPRPGGKGIENKSEYSPKFCLRVGEMVMAWAFAVLDMLVEPKEIVAVADKKKVWLQFFLGGQYDPIKYPMTAVGNI